MESWLKTASSSFRTSIGGHYVSQVTAPSSFDAAWQAVQQHERRNIGLGDDVILHVVVNGLTPSIWNFKEHNAAQKLSGFERDL